VAEHPPKPRLALTLGVIGHRLDRLPEPGRHAVEAAIGRVLDALAAMLQRTHTTYRAVYSGEPGLLVVVSALAEGADRMVATIALEKEAARRASQTEPDISARSMPSQSAPAPRFVLDAPLPFARDLYERDFKTSDSLAEFRALHARARLTLELAGTRRAGDTDDDQEANKAYETVGLTVLSQADILLTVWDGGPSGGQGGTTAMLDIAARSGIPIVHIDALGQCPPRIRWSGLHEFPVAVNRVEELPEADLDTGVEDLVDRLVRPPLDDDERRALLDYFGERSSPFGWRVEFSMLMLISGIRRMQFVDWRPVAPHTLARGFDAFTESAASAPARTLAAAYGWADAVGVRFARVFRSAVVTNFVLAALAVVLAVLPIVFHELKSTFVTLELIPIFLVLLNTTQGRRHAWHRRWFEAREIAERLRVALVLWLLGARSTTFFASEEPTWTGWYTRAIVRQQGLRSGSLDQPSLAAAREAMSVLLKQQCRYHVATAHAMQRLEHRLEWVGRQLFGTTIVTALGFLLFAEVPHRLFGFEISDIVKSIVTIVGAALPALGAATYGMRVIGDFGGIARRARRTRAALRRVLVATARDRLDLDRLRARARSAADAMLGDVASWRLSAESRGLDIPG
jgi:hypothetical protein